MQSTKKISPETYLTINDVLYYRLENGNIAVDIPDKVTIKSSKDDFVELITLNFKSTKSASLKKSIDVNFWKVNDTFYALASKSSVTLTLDTTFDDLYYSEHYPEGIYVKYHSSESCGILYVCETEISIVISHTENYDEIDFRDNLFFAKAKTGEEIYHVLAESGILLACFPEEVQKVPGYMYFYSKHQLFNICNDNISFRQEITSVVVNSFNEFFEDKTILVIEVQTAEGIYCLTEHLEYITHHSFNKIQFETLPNEHSYYIYDVDNQNTISNIFFISSVYTNETISLLKRDGFSGVKKMFTGIYKELDFVKLKFFLTTSDDLYYIRNNRSGFQRIAKNVKATEWTFNQPDQDSSRLVIIAYKNQLPIYYCLEGILNPIDGPIEILDTGLDNNSYICRVRIRTTTYTGVEKSMILVIKNGKELFLSSGLDCYTSEINPRNMRRYNNCYVIEKQDGSTFAIDRNGYVL